MFNDKPWAKLVKRARQMSWEELRVRAAQEVAKRSDLVLSYMGAHFVKDPGEPCTDRRGHFFFDPAEVQPILDWLSLRLPEVVDGVISQAEQICRHRFDLLGYRGVEYGAHIDWHLDAVHSKQAPRRPWFQVRYLDFDQVGDSKITWELSRHQHLVTLAKAYRLTGRQQYVQELFAQWYDWQKQNPYPLGINWASSLEVAFRSLSWLWISHLLQGCSVVPGRFASDLRRALMLNGRHIERFPSTYFSPNTHLLGEGVGLFFVGTLYPGSHAAQRWQHQGWQIVLREAQRQVRADGMHFEHSTYYHTYALDFFLHARVLAARNGLAIPAEFDNAIQKMLEVLCSLGNSGPLPRLGDDDGGRVFDPRRNELEHMLDPLALGAVLFNRGDFKAVAGNMREETIWLSGIDGAARFDKLSRHRPAPVSFCLRPSGIHVMSSSEPVTQQLVINTGPSEPGRDGHRHADALSLQLALGGDPVLIDPGTFAYVDQRCERNRFRGTPGHNTLHVDGLSQVESGAPFEWQSQFSTDVHQWVNGSIFDFFEGSQNGYSRLPKPVEHRRSIFFLKPQFWMVRDVVEGAGIHEIGVDWHFADGALTALPNGATFVGTQQKALSLQFTSSHRWSHEVCPDWYSPVYGRKEPAPLVRCTTRGRLPVELVTLLIPNFAPGDNLGVLESLRTEAEGASVRAYRYSVSGAGDRWFVFSAAPGSWHFGSWASDARFLFCSAGPGEEPDCFVMCDGSYLALNGRRILMAKERLKYGEFSSDGETQRFRCWRADVVNLAPPTRALNNFLPSDVLAAVSARP